MPMRHTFFCVVSRACLESNSLNNFSISTDGLASALQRSASALKTAGNDIDESIGLITAGNQIAQDPESVGAAMRTIALRLTGTSVAVQQLNDIGEDLIDLLPHLSHVLQEP